MYEMDPRDPEYERTGIPFDLLERIRAEEPVAHTPKGSWLLTRQQEINAALKDVESFRADLAPMSGLAGVEEIPELELWLSEIPEPRHGKVRRLYNAGFGPHRVARYEPFIRQTCADLVDAMLATDTPDLHGDYAMSIPAAVMAHSMGLPPEAADMFMGWSYDGTLMQRPCTPGLDGAAPPIQAYFEEQLAERRTRPEPPDDAFGVLMKAEIDGEPLSDREIVTQLQFMILAGVHTTRALLAHLAHRLLQTPELYQQVRADRELIPTLVEESLRHDSPVPATSRRCTRDVAIGGVEMHEGDWVEVGIVSAGRDEAAYECPAEFRLDRPDPRDHLSFGAGSHICPGATLARLEATTAVGVLCDKVAAMDPVEGVTYPPIPAGMGHDPIPARLTPA